MVQSNILVSSVTSTHIAQYAAPRGDYQVFEDARGGQWYAVRGEASVVFIMTTAKRLSFLK